MRRALVLLGLVSSLAACGGAPRPAATATSGTASSTRYVSASVAIAALPATSDGTPRIRTRVTLVDAAGRTVATLDLGESVSPATCRVDEAPSIAESMLSVTFVCGTEEHDAYRVTLVDHRDHVAIWTFLGDLGDEGGGGWDRMGDLYVPRGTRVRLSSELAPASAADALAAP